MDTLVDSINERNDFYAVLGFARLNGFRVDTKTAAKIGKRASQLCKCQGIKRGKTSHELYGFVYTYPWGTLKAAFEEFGFKAA